MIGIAQGIMGRAAGLDSAQLHRRFQGLLRGGAIGLGVEDHLGIVPAVCPALVQVIQPQIFPQNANVVKAPGQENDVLAAPAVKPLHGLREGDALLPQPGFLNARQLAAPAV